MKEKYSLALWWGAARWFAHIWVIQYIEENDIGIEEISWTSMWAIVASLYAIWKTSEEMIEISKAINYIKLIDVSLKEGLLKGDKIYKKLHSIFWEILIEELNIPLKIIATSIYNWERKVFESWKIIDAIRASISLPGIFKPHSIEGELYMDGGIVNNLPIECLNGKNIIAVSALKKVNEDLQSKRKILWVDFNVWFFKLNFQILQRTLIFMMKQNEDRSLQAQGKNIILIEPEYGELDFNSFNKVDELVGVWYREAEKYI